MGSHDLDNIKRREDRKARHNKRADHERDNMLQRYEEHVTIISWSPLDMGAEYDEYLVKFKLNKAMKPQEFLHAVVKRVGELLDV